jgi:hypothetical protein
MTKEKRQAAINHLRTPNEHGSLNKYLRPEILRIISIMENWSKDRMPVCCSACKKDFKDDDVPLSVWCHDGAWAMSFHLECAFKEGNISDADIT